MAKFVKMELYLCDPNDTINSAQDVVDRISWAFSGVRYSALVSAYHCREAEVPWDDTNPVNYDGCTQEQWDKQFAKEKHEKHEKEEKQ